MRAPSVRLALVILAVLVLQEAVFRGLRPDGVRPDLLLGLTVVAGSVGGPECGAAVGFTAGLVADLFLPTPLGLSALVWAPVGFGVGSSRSLIATGGRATVPATVLLASAAAVILFALAGAVLGLRAMVTPRLVPIVGIVSLINALVAIPFAQLVRWSLAGAPDRPYAA
jgi:rod shape-determining protein MreD